MEDFTQNPPVILTEVFKQINKILLLLLINSKTGRKLSVTIGTKFPVKWPVIKRQRAYQSAVRGSEFKKWKKSSSSWQTDGNEVNS